MIQVQRKEAGAIKEDYDWALEEDVPEAYQLFLNRYKDHPKAIEFIREIKRKIFGEQYDEIVQSSEDTAGCGILSFGCEDPLTLPPYDSGFHLKDYRRVKLYAKLYPWLGSGIELEQGDQVLVMASGKVTICRHCGHTTIDQPPNSHLRMRIGDGMNFIHYYGNKAGRGFYYSYGNTNNTGELQFAVEDDWSQYPPRKEVYTDNSGSYLLDVFVYDKAQEAGFKKFLRAMIRQHPEDTLFSAQAPAILK